MAGKIKNIGILATRIEGTDGDIARDRISGHMFRKK